MRPTRTLALLLALASSAAPASVVAQMGTITLTVPGTVMLDPVTLTDLIGQPTSWVDEGLYTPSYDFTGSLSIFTVDRPVTGLWTARIKDLDDVGSIVTTYTLLSTSGQPDELDHETGASAPLPCTITGDVPVLINIQGRNSNVRGDATFYLDAGATTASGRFTGTLIIEISVI